MNHFLLHLLAKTVSPGLRGRRVATVRLLPPVLSIALEGDRKPLAGVVILSAPGPFFYVDVEDPIAGMGTEVFRRIQGFGIRHVEVPAADRMIRFGLTAPRDEVTLCVSLFGSAAKVRLEGRETVVESLDPREAGSPLSTHAPREPRAGMGLADAGEADLARVIAAAEIPERLMPGLTRELLDSFRVPGGGVDIPRLLAFRDQLLRGGGTFLLATRRRPGSVCPIPTPVPAEAEPIVEVHGPFDDIENACRYAGRALVGSLREVIIQRHAVPLTKHLSTRKRLLSALQGERQDAERFDAIRREANILASYQSRITPGSAEVTLPDVYGSGDITVRLDPSIPVREQIKKRFRLAAKLERKGAALDKRVRVVDAEIASLEDALGAASAQRELRDAVSLIDRLKQRHRLDAGPPRSAKAHQRQKEFRQYELDPLWFVIVGRSDRENDEITFRIAGPDDIWLHAQHVAGSHVILKSRGTRANPPNPVLEAAARIAAHYSKARRASMVPVIYTRRKYVRKFRGAKPGQVLCEREKTILAVPKLPESTGG